MVRQTPEWLVEPPAAVRGRRVLVVDEMCSSGQTLQMVKARAVAQWKAVASANGARTYASQGDCCSASSGPFPKA